MAAAPGWCKSAGTDPNAYPTTDLALENAQRPQAADVVAAMDAVDAIVGFTCFPTPDSAPKAAAIEAARRSWSKQLGLGDADWGDVAVWGGDNKSEAFDLTNLHVAYDRKYAWSQLDAVEQFAAISNGFPNNPERNSAAWYTYLADALGPKLTETGRLAYIEKACFNHDALPVEWAMCAPDLARFDPTKIDGELRASKATPSYKTRIRFALWGLAGQVAKHATEVRAVDAKDSAYATMFALAAQTAAEWKTIYASDAALVDLALAMDDARELSSRKAFDGCADKVWPAWHDAVSRIPAKSFVGFSTAEVDSWAEPAMGVVAGTAPGYLASTALLTCAKGSGDDLFAHDVIVQDLGAVIGYAPGSRGPRTATQTAIARAGLQLDDTSAKIAWPDTDRRRIFTGQAYGGFYGTIAKVAPDAKGSKVTFSPKLDKIERCAVGKTTNRISYWRSNGAPSYEVSCSKWETIAVDRAPDPVVVPARFAKGLAAGMNVYYTGATGAGAVVAAWPKGSRAPAFVGGAPVK